ncbi:MAG: hypothetical protein J7L37_00125 [Thermococcus sp.]|nr:hypothetical protein [Thermococcus sp.]
MNTVLFIIALLFVAGATYANMKGARDLGLVLAGIAGGLAVVVLLYDRTSPLIAFAVGFIGTAAFEKLRFTLIKR